MIFKNKLILCWIWAAIFVQTIFAQEGVKFHNVTNNYKLIINYKPSGEDWKSITLNKPGESSRVISTGRKGLAARDISDLSVEAFDIKDGSLLEKRIWSDNISIENDKVTTIEIGFIGGNLRRKIFTTNKKGETKLAENFSDKLGKSAYADNAKSIIVYNETDSPLYAATYYKTGATAKRSSDVKEIAPNKNVMFDLPKLKPLSERKLFFSETKKEIKDELDKRSVQNTINAGIGVGMGDDFYIAVDDNGKLNSYRSKEVMAAATVISSAINSLVDSLRKTIKMDSREAQVSVGPELCKEESEFLKKRQVIVKDGIKKLLKLDSSINIDKDFIVTVASSGGGYRAMIANAGFYAGLEETGLLDLITYSSGISGSTWYLCPWIYYGKNPLEQKKFVQEKTEHNLWLGIFDPNIILENLIVKKLYGKSVNFIDFYGEVLENKFWRADKHTYLSDLAESLKDGKMPMPILTAINPGDRDYWFEFTPYQIGANKLDFYVPTWAFGRKFNKGKAIDYSREERIGFYMGTFGSAFALTIRKNLGVRGWPEKAKKIFNKFVDPTGLDENRVWPAIVFNPVKNMDNPNLSSVKNLENFQLVDAGEISGFPLSPYIRRKPHVIFLCDADPEGLSRNVNPVRNLKKWCEHHNFKFPEIDKQKENNKNIEALRQNPVLILENLKDADVPTVIYCGLLKNDKFNSNFDPEKETKSGFCSTYIFAYTKENFNLLSGIMQYAINQNKDAIIAAIKRKVESVFKKVQPVLPTVADEKQKEQ